MTGKFSDEMKNRREEIIGEDVGFPCDNRGRRCCAAIGLISHQIHCPRTLPVQGSRTLMNTNDDNTTHFQNYASNVFSSSCNWRLMSAARNSVGYHLLPCYCSNELYALQKTGSVVWYDLSQSLLALSWVPFDRSFVSWLLWLASFIVKWTRKAPGSKQSADCRLPLGIFIDAILMRSYPEQIHSQIFASCWLPEKLWYRYQVWVAPFKNSCMHLHFST